MTRKDYQLIASALATAWYNTQAGREDVAYRMADALQADNPRFDRDKFLVAAGVYEKCDSCDNRATTFSTSMQWCAAHKGKGLIKVEEYEAYINDKYSIPTIKEYFQA